MLGSCRASHGQRGEAVDLGSARYRVLARDAGSASTLQARNKVRNDMVNERFRYCMVWENPYHVALHMEHEMVAVLEKAAKVYGKGQTNVPAEVRNALDLHSGDRVIFSVEQNGTVMLRKAEVAEVSDPAMDAFLHFLAEDIRKRPADVRPLTADLEARLKALTQGTVIDRENDRIESSVGL